MKPAPRQKIKLLAVLSCALVTWACDPTSTRAGQSEQPESAPAATAAPGTIQAAPAPVTTQATAAKPLPENLQELVKLAERGLGDEVLIAWVKNSAVPFQMTSDDVVYLTDLGVSEAVIKAMLEHRGAPVTAVNPPVATAPINPPIAQVPASPAPAVTVTAAPEFETAPQQPQPQTQVTYVEQPAPVQYNYFYGSLAPYGSWIEVSGYGLCWRPTVAVVDTGWRPYCHSGRWLYTNCGWYWQSDYSWGWAPFHYGRWRNHPGSGWVWMPDTTWSPAWVTWRYSDAYCGWAPLPPGSHYRSGIGLTYHSAGVSIGFDFGLERDCYTFIPTRRFCDRTPWRHAVPHTRIGNAYNQTTIINNINVNPHNTLINEGPGRERIASITRSEVRKVNLRDVPSNTARAIPSDRLDRSGKDLAVYRPFNATLPAASSRAPDRHEVAKTETSLSPRGAAMENTPSATTVHSVRNLNTPLPHTAVTPLSGGTGNRVPTVSAPPLAAKPGVETRSADTSGGRRVLSTPAPVSAAPTPRFAQPAPASVNPSPFTSSATTIRSTPSSSQVIPTRATASQPSPIAAPLVNQQPPQTIYRAPVATLPSRQEVSKPQIISAPASQNYSAPAPAAVRSAPAYSPGPAIQSVPRYSPGTPPPQAVRATPGISTGQSFTPPPRASEPAARAPAISTPHPAAAPPPASSGNSTRNRDREREK
jgi:hypothetical protein